MRLFQNNKKILAFIIIFIFLSTISNKFISNKKNFFTIENINIYGVNSYIKKDLHSDIFYLKGKNFF